MHEPGDSVIVADNGLAVSPGLHTLFDIEYTVVSMKNFLWALIYLYKFIKDNVSLWYYRIWSIERRHFQ